MAASIKTAILDAAKAARRKLTFESVMDGFQNLVTGFGTSRSKSHANSYTIDPPLDMPTIEALLMGNDLAKKIVNKIVDDALRGGFSLERHGGDADADREMARKIELAYEAKGCPEQVHRGGCFGRGYGGGGLILSVRGGGTVAGPLEDGEVTKLDRLYDWCRRDMQPYSWYPNGDVEAYLWTPVSKGAGPTPAPLVVHESRMIFFPGAFTTNDARRHNLGWDHSVLQRAFNVLKSFDGMWASTDAMFADASQAIFRLQGLIAALAEDGGEGSTGVMTRLQLMDMTRSTTKAVMLDAGDENGNGAEDYTTVDRATLGNLDGVMGQYFVRLASAADMPLTVLLGMSPAGMDATGESDLILYYNTVDVYRQSVLKARILRLVRMIARELGDEDPESWEICWPELARPKPLDSVTAQKMSIDGLVALVTGQIVLPEEVALCFSRIMREGLTGLKLDIPSRQKALKDGLDEIANREMTGPGAEPVEPPVGPSAAPKSSERKTPSKAAKAQV